MVDVMAAYLFLVALALVGFGASIAWPVAKRAGRREALDEAALPAWVHTLAHDPPPTPPPTPRPRRSPVRWVPEHTSVARRWRPEPVTARLGLRDTFALAWAIFGPPTTGRHA